MFYMVANTDNKILDPRMCVYLFQFFIKSKTHTYSDLNILLVLRLHYIKINISLASRAEPWNDD